MTMTALSNPSQHVFVDPEYRIFKEMIDIQMQHQSPPPMDTVADIRNATDGMLAMVASTFAYPDGMQESVHFAPSSLSSSCAPHLIPITRYIPIATASATGSQRAILYIHGGGLIAGSVKSFRLWAAEFAERSGTQIFSVDYRLAPGFAIAPSCAKIEPPAPFAVHDVLDALSWLQFLDTASEFGIDPARIVLSENNERNDLNISYYTSPARCCDLTEMPPTLIDVPTLDLLKNEAITFATRLANANVAIQLNVYPGVAHGFDGQIPEHRLSKLMKLNNVQFIQRF
ncbi:hypothetical protein NXS19_014336 [Fusarium pseudograminearum]|nr:hypothetical protein NXS19_014336 [Fusarium pseudograminearum]